ncbi:hypothetical protein GGR34_003378 [Microvirga flocculans]|uniref:PilZ domain-containing protein n=2 Tax=Microvirga flocculans TaxID=217168 RepID=A0A7W6N9N8_9HYPH|nr:PilZ domain-containing protein [Microvirga flocculans]MBB4041700.1 hypothetical protein [Microvirga flocculans]
MPERRSSKRYPIYLEGLITVAADRAPIACTVWDLSETGVRLVLASPCDIPVEFELYIPSEGARARVRLIWTNGIHYGAAFKD